MDELLKACRKAERVLHQYICSRLTILPGKPPSDREVLEALRAIRDAVARAEGRKVEAK